MLLSISDKDKIELKKRITEGTVLANAHERYITSQNNKQREWDRYIHPSALDWSSSVEAQIKKLQKTWKPNPEALQRMQIGNLIHDYFQEKQDKYFFGGKSRMEQHIENNKALFRGTPDQWGPHKHLGNVLVEYKSISSYQRDKRAADRLIKKIQVPAEIYDEIYAKLGITYVDYQAPKSDHLTQAFTYVLLLQWTHGIQIDHVCICYIRKENLGTIEFWLAVSQCSDYMKKAYENYIEIYKEIKRNYAH